MESPFKADILRGKVALVTGGGSGIGFEISAQFGKHGASVAIMGRRKQVLEAAVSALQSLGIPVEISTLQLLFPPKNKLLNHENRSLYIVLVIYVFVKRYNL